MATSPRFKRTTPFEEQCCFVADTGEGLWERCEEEADFGLYFGDNARVTMVSLCHYHTVYQESLWIAGKE
jgi:hypothetical protein